MKHFILTYGSSILIIGFLILLFQNIPHEVKQKIEGFWKSNAKKIYLGLWVSGLVISGYLLYHNFLEPAIDRAGGVRPALSAIHHKFHHKK